MIDSTGLQAQDYMKRFISEFPGYFSPEDLKKMQAEFEAGEVPGETLHDKEARAQQILHRFEIRKRSAPTTDN